MSSEEWHRFNNHFKSLIMEENITVKCKSLEPLVLDDFIRFIITSNQNAPIKIDIRDSCVICFKVLA